MPATEPIVSQIFNALNHLTVRNKDQEISFTVSMGVSGISSTDKTPDDFYNRVDDNLYHSKKNGRMQITAI
ncbi:hypothetical protein LNA01_01030 [Companilactobacillus nantensis]|uniref:GGDEF domain-containing protein n=1 Tax=Companilactobacillus nantensis DSM 16982 TaxID=1423774 RepID=A0A0R1WKN8_9LACO|nr:hypothetical protein FD31_GL001587 [Companilactobacillus nantensis DSM 16982]GEO62920.1 hypothetical protein LNA01_01030 [Companilactobacillus nantensis]